MNISTRKGLFFLLSGYRIGLRVKNFIKAVQGLRGQELELFTRSEDQDSWSSIQMARLAQNPEK